MAAVVEGLAGEPIIGQGTPEAQWRGAGWLRALPLVSFAALWGGARRLRVVAPHPDDEVLGCGGLMALARAQGLPVRVDALSDGEQAYPQEPAWAPATLAPARRAELEAALGELGIAPGQVHGHAQPDGGLRARVPEIAQALAASWQPGDLWLVTWRRDGHPDHEAAAEATLRASALVGGPVLEYPVWAWHWARPHASPFGNRPCLRLVLPSSVRQAKRRALARFATQTGDCQPRVREPVLPPHVLERFERDFEVFLA